MKILMAGFLVLISAVGVSAQTVSCYYTDSKFAFSLGIDTASNTQNYQLENGGTYHPFKGKWEGGGTFYAKQGDRHFVEQLLITPDQIKLDQQIKTGKNSEGLDKNSIGHFLYTADRTAGTFTMVFSIYQDGQDTHKEARSGTCR
jgi:hypothetical protein